MSRCWVPMINLLESIGKGSVIFEAQPLGKCWVISPKDGQESAFVKFVDELTVGHCDKVVAQPVTDALGRYVRAVVAPFETEASS